jgi:tetratricopeptide (TPR) repeat protein
LGSDEPETRPPSSTRLRLAGLFLGIALVALIPLANLFFDPPPDTAGNRSFDAGNFERLPEGLAHPDTDPQTSRLQVIGGGLLSDYRQSAGLEAVLRLHIYLALRDVYPAALELDWSPAGRAQSRDALIAQRCNFEQARSRLLPSGAPPDPLGRTVDPGRDQRLFVLVSGRPAALQVEAVLCNRRGAQRAQVISVEPGKEGATVRELATWAGAVTGAADPGSLADGWARPPAPGRPGLSRYGEVLVGSTGATGHVEKLLDEASEEVPEAAWLLAHLGSPRDSLVHLRRARLGRPSFTAAIEDRAALLLAEGQRDSALRELSLLTLTTDSRSYARPVRSLIASQMVELERPLAALAVIETMKEDDRGRASVARIAALANLALARDGAAAEAVEIWLAAQPRSGEALAAAGRLRAAVDRWPSAEAAWEQAVLGHPALRDATLRDWAQAALDRHDIARLDKALAAIDREEPGIGSSTFALELQAYLAARGGRFREAMRIYDRLVEADQASMPARQNRCHVAVLSGQADQAAGRCAGLTPAPLEGALASSAFDSRRPGRLPGYPLDTTVAALFAVRTAPRDAAVSVTALHSLGPNASPAQREELLARWRLAVGAGIEVPENVFAPPGPKR